jgi:7 transmembrane receptor (rhodopsin family)
MATSSIYDEHNSRMVATQAQMTSNFAISITNQEQLLMSTPDTSFINVSRFTEADNRSTLVLFQIVATVTAVVGLAVNGTVLFVMVSDKLVQKSAVNAFICNQSVLDLVACLTFFVTLILQQVGVLDNESGVLGLIMCWTFDGNTLLITVVYASRGGLIIVTLERYVKIVHPVQHRSKFRPWMTRVGLALPWMNGILANLIPAWATRRAEGSRCMSRWSSTTASNVYSMIVLVWQFLLL